jgi:hypothetical protein
MPKPMEVAEWSEKTYEHSRLETKKIECKYGPEFWTQGTVITEHALVRVVAGSWMCKTDKGLVRQAFTRLKIVGYGMTHVREFRHRHYSFRYIVTLAKRFARELHAAGALHITKANRRAASACATCYTRRIHHGR